MKRVDRLEDLPATMELAAAEAGAAFGDARVYLERFVTSGRHVEVQVLGDGNGRVIHLGERDCSTQRRYQKLVEETPAPGLSTNLRSALHAAAVRFAERLSYRGAGTVEFLVDRERDTFYFLEMNARIQVEHPVTEAVTGVDLVVECRVNAEDPAHDFRPSPGLVREVTWPSGEGIRVDTHIAAGSRVPPFYDSLMAKIIAHAPERDSAVARLRDAIGATRLTGVLTNLPFHELVLADAEFQAGGFDTGFVARLIERRDTAERARNG
jgi:acetyl-CoA carboxylase biotin carboxylase subunit